MQAPGNGTIDRGQFVLVKVYLLWYDTDIIKPFTDRRNNPMMKFCQKMDKKVFPLVLAAFVWILLCNVLVQVLHAPLASIGIPGWTIFLANVLFFIKNNPDHKEGLLENALGGIFGLLGAMGLLYFVGSIGIDPIVATIIAIAVFLFLTIALHPMLPYVFNNNALCFFLVALINDGTRTALKAYPFSHFAGVLIGNLIVNIGTVLIVDFVAKKMAKKKG